MVSGGELKKALAAGIPAEQDRVFRRRQDQERNAPGARAEGIYQFNVESEPELEALNEVALSMGKRAPVTLRINPDVDAKTHAKITTGTSETKFGIPFAHAREAYAQAARLKGIEIVGIDVHIGSQITDLEPFEAAFRRVARAGRATCAPMATPSRAWIWAAGWACPISRTTQPPPDPAAYGAMVTQVTEGLDCRLIFEPGRLIAANAGVLVTRVIYVKQGDAKTFLIIDAGMNDLIRPGAVRFPSRDRAASGNLRPARARVDYDVVGPVCETSDLFAAGPGPAGAEIGRSCGDPDRRAPMAR